MIKLIAAVLLFLVSCYILWLGIKCSVIGFKNEDGEARSAGMFVVTISILGIAVAAFLFWR